MRIAAPLPVTLETGDKPAPPAGEPDSGDPKGKTEKPVMVRVREWRFRDGREYRDRNGDGIVDWEARGDARLTDGFGVYKEDTDFDGFYDREYEAGGFAYHVRYDKRIREPVPRIDKVYAPTRIRRQPSPEMPGAPRQVP